MEKAGDRDSENSDNFLQKSVASVKNKKKRCHVF